MSDENLNVVGEWKERVWIVRAADGRSSAEPATLSKLRRGLELGKLTEDMTISRDGEHWENIRHVIDRVSKRVARPAPSPNESQELPALSERSRAYATEATPRAHAAPPPSNPVARAERMFPPPTMRAASSFGGGLFDFTFSTYVTTSVVRVLYVLHLLFVLMWLGGWTLAGIVSLGSGASGGSSSSLAAGSIGGVGSIVIGLVSSTIFLLFGRVFLECIVVAFRIAETLGEINAKTR